VIGKEPIPYDASILDQILQKYSFVKTLKEAKQEI